MTQWTAIDTDTGERAEFRTVAEAKAWATEQSAGFGSWSREETRPGVVVWCKGHERELAALVFRTENNEAVAADFGL